MRHLEARQMLNVAPVFASDFNTPPAGGFLDGETWWAFDSNQGAQIPGWTGKVEYQCDSSGNYWVELDTDDNGENGTTLGGDTRGSITSTAFDMAINSLYELSFDAKTRPDNNVQLDNMLSVTVPGTVVSVRTSKGDVPLSHLFGITQDGNTLTFPTTGILFNQMVGIPYTTDLITVEGIIFQATTTSGSVTFADASDYVDSRGYHYGPWLDDVSVTQKFFADINVDSNNDGVINDMDDPIEMGNALANLDSEGAFGKLLGKGRELDIQLAHFTGYQDSLLNVSIQIEGTASFSFSQPTVSDTSMKALATSLGSAVIKYDVYLKSTNELLASDSVLVTVVDLGSELIDLAIDSNNSECIDSRFCDDEQHYQMPSARNTLDGIREEFLEDHPYGIGKMILVDKNAQHFIPFTLTLSEDIFSDYTADYLHTTLTFDYCNALGQANAIYISQVDKDPVNLFHQNLPVLPNVPYSIYNLGFSRNNLSQTFYIEPLTPVRDELGGFVQDSPLSSEQLNSFLGTESLSAFLQVELLVKDLREEESSPPIVQVNDSVKYFVTTKGSFYDRFIHNEALRAAVVSSAVYSNVNLQHLGLQKLSSSQLSSFTAFTSMRDILAGNSHPDGLGCGVYHDYHSGKNILVFEGTTMTSYEDWENNIRQGLGHSTVQYNAALTIGRALSEWTYQETPIFKPDAPLDWIITGHSLGGGLATAAGIAANINNDLHVRNNAFRVITFNAAWVRPETFQMMYNTKWRAEFLTDIEPLVFVYQKSYYVENDILTMGQFHGKLFVYELPIEWLGVKCSLTAIPSSILGPIQNNVSIHAHFMSSVITQLIQN
ncbi:MAG: hypothetical protein Q4C96_08765 [Planctomycetia bacterium]|nr:hypothetical protein [Planctomycetia bacterium]